MNSNIWCDNNSSHLTLTHFIPCYVQNTKFLFTNAYFCRVCRRCSKREKPNAGVISVLHSWYNTQSYKCCSFCCFLYTVNNWSVHMTVRAVDSGLLVYIKNGTYTLKSTAGLRTKNIAPSCT